MGASGSTPANGGADFVREIEQLRTWLETPVHDSETFPDEAHARLVCRLAVEAAAAGNYGVGSILLAENGAVLTSGMNSVFSPTFRTDLHAEMVVLNAWEEANPNSGDLSGLTIFVSLEPCPMCLTRIIMSGVGTVRFVVDDPGGGMVDLLDCLPVSFRRLAEKQKFLRARCSPTLREIGQKAFSITLLSSRAKLLAKRGISRPLPSTHE